MIKKVLISTTVIVSLMILVASCNKEQIAVQPDTSVQEIENTLLHETPYLFQCQVPKDITIENYFDFIDSIIVVYDSLTPYNLDEYLLVRANPWIIDSLADTDYYRMMKKGQFVFDQKKITILHQGDTLNIPRLQDANKILVRQSCTVIDINVPEFKLRIFEGKQLLFTFPVRVGQNRERYLQTAGRIENLRTRLGTGKIFKVKRDPSFINPVDGKRFTRTRRDDKRLTMMPLIPWLDTEINGHRFGQMIHPTTNPKTLEKASSNGCIGTREADAWYIYYHAPVGTKVRIRYDLDIVNDAGDSIRLKNIYDRK